MLTDALMADAIEITASPIPTSSQEPSCLFRFVIKSGEYTYARVNDILLIESCDHWVKIHLAFEGTIRRVIRNNTLKDFLAQLPVDCFTRIGRFCAVNMKRLSGGSYNEQSFEFDFKTSIKLKHSISLTAFNAIGK